MGLTIEYESLPGPKVNNWNELLLQTKELLFKTVPFLKDREKWKKSLYKFNDEENCKRITNHFKSFLKI